MCIFISNACVIECVHAYVNLFMYFYTLFNLYFYRWQQSPVVTVVEAGVEVGMAAGHRPVKQTYLSNVLATLILASCSLGILAT